VSATCVARIVGRLVTVNLEGQGISDGQKVLIAAVQLDEVSREDANKISELNNLGLSWEKEV